MVWPNVQSIMKDKNASRKPSETSCWYLKENPIDVLSSYLHLQWGCVHMLYNVIKPTKFQIDQLSSPMGCFGKKKGGGTHNTCCCSTQQKIFSQSRRSIKKWYTQLAHNICWCRNIQKQICWTKEAMSGKSTQLWIYLPSFSFKFIN